MAMEDREQVLRQRSGQDESAFIQIPADQPINTARPYRRLRIWFMPGSAVRHKLEARIMNLASAAIAKLGQTRP